MRHKIKGLVIREIPKGETSKLLTVLTDTMGVLTVNAKGVRKLTSPYLKSAQLFAFSDMLLHEKNGFYTLTEAALITDFYPVSKDIKNYALACYLCEVASSFALGGEDSSVILRLLLNSLYAIEKNIASLTQIKSVFELRICGECGFEPSTCFCSRCDSEIVGKEGYFNVAEGESYCDYCALHTEDTYYITPAVSDALYFIIESDLSRVLQFKLPDEDLKLLSRITERYILLRAECSFKTLAFYKQCEELK